jgi:ketosteroid isomerase-like protein
MAAMLEALGFGLLIAVASPAFGQGPPEAQASSGRLLEIRSYNLTPGARERFHNLFVRESLPLLRRWNVDVIAYGRSLHDTDSYFLMRAFSSIDERDRIEQAFYDSAEWRDGPRADVLAMIESYTTVVIDADDGTVRGLRGSLHAPNGPSDLDLLLRLNDDYITAIKTANVKRFSEILADDFLCTLSDGRLLSRAEFLEMIAKPGTIDNLRADKVNVRLMGDFAIVHASTSFTLPDGLPGSGRYTDVWARRRGEWLAVAAHVTRK